MVDSIFTSRPDGAIIPTEHARGPWDSGTLHGGASAALIATAFQQTPAHRHRDGSSEGMMIARMSFELLRPVPMTVLRLQITIVRPGRRVQSLRAELRTEDGVLVCEATATRVAVVPAGLVVPAGATSGCGHDGDGALATPEEGRQIRFTLNDSAGDHDFATAMDMRLISGGPFGVTDNPGGTDDPRTRIWMRPRYPLFPDRPMSPLARIAAGADFGNGISAILPFGEYLFINADLHVSLMREPVGEWIALDALTQMPVGGVGWAESVLHDSQGRVGRATQALVVEPR